MVNEEQQTPSPWGPGQRADGHDDAHMTTGYDRDKATTGSSFSVTGATIGAMDRVRVAYP
jgi:hypothetical protein